MWLMIIVKVTKNQGFSLCLEDTVKLTTTTVKLTWNKEGGRRGGEGGVRLDYPKSAQFY